MKAFFILLFMISTHALAKHLNLTDLHVDCSRSNVCDDIKENFKSLKRKYVNVDHLNKILKLYVINEGIKNFNYSIIKKSENKINLSIRLIPKDIISSVSVKVQGADLGYPSVLPLAEGDYLDVSRLKRSKVLLKDVYKGYGFPDTVVEHKYIKDIEEGVGVQFIVKTGKPVRVKSISVITESSFLGEMAKRKLSHFRFNPFNMQKIKDSVDDLRVLFLDYGYYLVEMKLRYKVITKREVDLFLEINAGDLHKFDIRVNEDLKTTEHYKKLLSQTVITYKRKLNEKIVNQILEESLEKDGYLFPTIKILTKEYINKYGEKTIHFKVDLKKGPRSFVKNINFSGNTVLSDDYLKRRYLENAFELASRNIYDKNYYKNYTEIVREEYISRGYVNVFIDVPQIQVLPKSKRVNILFRLREGVAAKVKTFNINGISKELKNVLLENVQTKKNNNFNPIAFKSDLEIIEKKLKQEGFYFSEITNKSLPTLVQYSNGNSQVFININVKIDKRLFANNIIIAGNRKTLNHFIRREIFIKKGEMITPEVISKSQTSLLSTGLFSSVKIKPVQNSTSRADILISVREKDFGLVEFAPGVRTDLGPKVSASVSYNNLDGMNKKILSKIQVNQRYDLTTLDERRRVESNSLIEYSFVTNYSENKIFNSPVDFSTSISKARRRFFSFDADIQKISLTGSLDFNKIFSTSLTYQLETISQYDSTLEREHGHFQIGALTPSFIIDLRDNRINPNQGAYFRLSCEFANPTFLSQNNDELVINYYKLISRNRFYAKIPNGVLALSLSAGYQKNMATDKRANSQGEVTTEGYIPNIKVFRLSGMDIVRGFEDDEINRLVSNQDISEVRVDQRAYMANIKFEPRFYLSDSSMLGVFYDAGRIFVGSYDLEQLRSSAGVTFKYITPVGTLDFDYGIKLLRKRDADGTLESPGRLHVSIGFF